MGSTLLEIPETQFWEGSEGGLKVMNKVQGLGVRIRL